MGGLWSTGGDSGLGSCEHWRSGKAGSSLRIQGFGVRRSIGSMTGKVQQSCRTSFSYPERWQNVVSYHELLKCVEGLASGRGDEGGVAVCSSASGPTFEGVSLRSKHLPLRLCSRLHEPLSY